MKKILVLLAEYPQLSETYIKNELDFLSHQFELEIITIAPGSYPYRSRRPHLVINQKNEKYIFDYIKRFKPDFIHAHYMHMLPMASRWSAALGGIPYTVRAHSFDVLGVIFDQVNVSEFSHDRNLQGILCFPFMKEKIVNAGIPAEKVIPSFPIIDVLRFRNKDKNGSDIMNVGAAIPKKNMDSYIHLSKKMPERVFNLYAMGYITGELKKFQEEVGGRVNFIPPLEPEDMPFEYKKHEWLVYTASHKEKTVGWPIALIEAMASGVGVCVQNIRPDLSDFIGDAGFLFESIEDVAKIISSPMDAQRRLRGFEWAEQYDYRSHMPQLVDLWK